MMNLVNLVDRFIKSANFGKKTSERFKRTTSLMFVAIWSIGFIMCTYQTVLAIRAIPNYLHARELYKEYDNDPLKNIRGPRWDSFYDEVIDNPSSTDAILPYTAVKAVECDVKRLYAIPIFIFFGFLMPWLLIRLYSWIKISDRTNLS